MYQLKKSINTNFSEFMWSSFFSIAKLEILFRLIQVFQVVQTPEPVRPAVGSWFCTGKNSNISQHGLK